MKSKDIDATLSYASSSENEEKKSKISNQFPFNVEAISDRSLFEDPTLRKVTLSDYPNDNEIFKSYYARKCF